MPHLCLVARVFGGPALYPFKAEMQIPYQYTIRQSVRARGGLYLQSKGPWPPPGWGPALMVARVLDRITLPHPPGAGAALLATTRTPPPPALLPPQGYSPGPTNPSARRLRLNRLSAFQIIGRSTRPDWTTAMLLVCQPPHCQVASPLPLPPTAPRRRPPPGRSPATAQPPGQPPTLSPSSRPGWQTRRRDSYPPYG